MRSRMGRRRLPPAPAMNSPISWISATGESISSAIASSTALSSGPTARATRSFSSASSGVGAFTIRARGGGSTDDDAVFHLDLRSRGEILDLDDRELVADLGDLPRRHLLVQLTQQLARDGVDDGDLVAAHTHGAAGPDPVLRRQVDDESGGVHVDDIAAGGRRSRGSRTVGPRRSRHRRHRAARRRQRRDQVLHLVGAALARADAPAPRRRAVLGHDLRRREDALLAEDQRLQRERDLFLLDPGVFGLARHIPEARVLDEQPPGLGRTDGNAGIVLGRKSRQLAQAHTARGQDPDSAQTHHQTDSPAALHREIPFMTPQHSRFPPPPRRLSEKASCAVINAVRALALPAQGPEPRAAGPQPLPRPAARTASWEEASEGGKAAPSEANPLERAPT